jgi:hypothetical protein
MLIALLLQLAAPDATTRADAFADRAWGSFSRSPALARRREHVDMVVDGQDGGNARPLQYKLRLVTTDPNGRDVLWANSHTCPAVRTVIASLRDLQPSRPMPPGFDTGDLIVMADGTGYALDVPVTDRVSASRITWRSNIGTPLAKWVDDALAALEPCWSAVELWVSPARKP